MKIDNAPRQTAIIISLYSIISMNHFSALPNCCKSLHFPPEFQWILSLTAKNQVINAPLINGKHTKKVLCKLAGRWRRIISSDRKNIIIYWTPAAWNASWHPEMINNLSVFNYVNYLCYPFWTYIRHGNPDVQSEWYQSKWIKADYIKADESKRMISKRMNQSKWIKANESKQMKQVNCLD